MRKTLAVVDDQWFYTYEQRFSHPAGTLDELLLLMPHMGFTHVWVVPGTALSRTCSVPGEHPGWEVGGIYQNKKQEHYNFLRARRPGRRHDENIYVGFPEFSWWPWEGDDNPKVLLATIQNLEDGLRLPLEWSPAHMSLAYTECANLAHRYWLKAPRVDLLQHDFTYGAIEMEVNWPPEGHEVAISPDATHHVEIDGNSAYAAGMTGLNIGEGDPEWIDDFRGVELAYDGKKPGYWHISRCEKEDSIFDGVQLPSFEGCQWMSTDLVEQLRMSGYSIAIDQGWCWQRHHQALRHVAENLWKLRVHWRTLAREKPESKTCENIHETLRVIIKAIHGKQPPAIRAMVVGRSIAMMVYRIGKIYRQYGVKPVRIKVDGLRYAVSDPHLLDSILDEDKLGGFKLVSIEPVASKDS